MAKRKARFRVAWAATACADLDAIINYIAEDSPQAALSVLEKLEQSAARLTTVPERGRVVPELRAIGVYRYRELIVSPWRIIYRVSESTVHVLAVVDSRRDLADLLLERFVR